MSIKLGQFASFFFVFIVFQLFCQLNVVFFSNTRYWFEIIIIFFSSTVIISFAKDSYLWPQVTCPQRRLRYFPIMHHYMSSLPNYLVMTSYHWNVRQNILTWRCWMNNKITWRHARIVPTLFLCLFHWMSINLGQFASFFFFFFYCFSTFLSAERFFFKYALLVWNLTNFFFRVP